MRRSSIPTSTPNGKTADNFNRFVAVDEGVQTAADSTEAALCAEALQQPATDTAVKSDDGRPVWRAKATANRHLKRHSLVHCRVLTLYETYLEGKGCEDYPDFYAVLDKVN